MTLAAPRGPSLLDAAAPAAPEAPAPPRPARPEKRLRVPPAPVAEVLALERALGVSHATAQVLVRRGLGAAQDARAWLAADEAHDPSAFCDVDAAVAVVLRHVGAGTRITVHGDYDVDGVCSTAVLVRVLRRLGAQVDWYLPSRSEDGYGLAMSTVQRLAVRGTRLLVTADCAITAVAEVARARALGMDVVVTDHHTPRADPAPVAGEGAAERLDRLRAAGVLPDAPIVHPALCGYPCPELCAAGVAHKLAGALLAAAGRDPAEADEDLDLVALATVCDVVALRGENRRLVRAGLRALAATRKPGLRALMRVARVDPSRIDAKALGFRLGPRINAAGRLARADAGLELVLTEDPERAAAIAEELDRVNVERRAEEQRALWSAEAQVAEQGASAGYVLAGEGWHPGVVGIVAGRIADRYHRPAVCIALGPQSGTGSARSVAGFDLLAALDACAGHLVRHGGHRAAAGLEVERGSLEAFRAAFAAHCEQALPEELRFPVERVDAVVAGDELGLALAEELAGLAPFGQGNPEVSLLVPACRLVDPRPMGEGKHVRFTVEAGGMRARAVAFGTDGKLPCPADGPVDATFALEVDEWDGAVEPRLVLRRAAPSAPAPITVLEPEGTGLDRALAAARAEPPAAAEQERRAAASDAPPSLFAAGAVAPLSGAARLCPDHEVRDRRGGGVAGVIGALAASGEPVLVVCADVRRRLPGLAERVGGFALTSHAALERAPRIAAGYAHLVVLDPPPRATLAAAPGPLVHLVHGAAEDAFALAAHEAEHDLRPAATALYRALRQGAPLPDALAQAGRSSPEQAGRALRVLLDVGLVAVDWGACTATVPASPVRVSLDDSPTFRAHERERDDGRRWLTEWQRAEAATTAPRRAA